MGRKKYQRGPLASFSRPAYPCNQANKKKKIIIIIIIDGGSSWIENAIFCMISCTSMCSCSFADGTV